MSVMFLISIRLGKAIRRLGASNYTFYATKSGPGSNWVESRRSCKETGSDLVSIESLEEWKFLKKTIETMGTEEYFIGLRKDGYSGEWRWLSDNSTVNKTKGTFPWAKGEPSGDGYCAVIYRDYRNDYGKYNDLNCTTKKRKPGFICESQSEGNGKEGMSHKLNTFRCLLSIFLLLSRIL